MSTLERQEVNSLIKLTFAISETKTSFVSESNETFACIKLVSCLVLSFVEWLKHKNYSDMKKKNQRQAIWWNFHSNSICVIRDISLPDKVTTFETKVNLEQTGVTSSPLRCCGVICFLYDSPIYSQTSYCNIVWGNTYSTYLNRIYIYQEKWQWSLIFK